EVLHRVCRWWEIDFQLWRSFSEWDEWFSSIRLPGSVKEDSLKDAVVLVFANKHDLSNASTIHCIRQILFVGKYKNNRIFK
ncbi:hypothetical protein Tco_0117707, partial [Tanacetum coccineum]